MTMLYVPAATVPASAESIAAIPPVKVAATATASVAFLKLMNILQKLKYRLITVKAFTQRKESPLHLINSNPRAKK
jgi:hypothetical protein